jgi:hypothetical protein
MVVIIEQYGDSGTGDIGGRRTGPSWGFHVGGSASVMSAASPLSVWTSVEAWFGGFDLGERQCGFGNQTFGGCDVAKTNRFEATSSPARDRRGK